jgi:hypothetical protein
MSAASEAAELRARRVANSKNDSERQRLHRRPAVWTNIMQTFDQPTLSNPGQPS